MVAESDVGYPKLKMGVNIFDARNNTVVATVEKTVTPHDDGTFHTNLTWTGTDLNGQSLPPGDYAPSFYATAADGETAMATTCSGLTLGGGAGNDPPTNPDGPDNCPNVCDAGTPDVPDPAGFDGQAAQDLYNRTQQECARPKSPGDLSELLDKTLLTPSEAGLMTPAEAGILTPEEAGVGQDGLVTAPFDAARGIRIVIHPYNQLLIGGGLPNDNFGLRTMRSTPV
jgi:hypothetical protein